MNPSVGIQEPSQEIGVVLLSPPSDRHDLRPQHHPQRDATHNEIEETLERYGADGFAYATQGNLATVIFAMENRVRIAPWVHRFSDVESFHHWLNLLMPTSSQANPLSNKLSSYSGFSSMARL